MYTVQEETIKHGLHYISDKSESALTFYTTISFLLSPKGKRDKDRQ